jgi:hypothetical protein
VAVLFSPAAASAQAGGQPSPPTGPRWEIEGYGGLSRGTAASDGSASLPPAGAPIPSLSPIFPSRRTSSWFFGDGAAMLNSASEGFGLAARITPLDAALTSRALDYSSAAALGVRVRRIVSARWSAEIGVDLLPGSGDISEEFSAALNETRTSFESSFRALLAEGPTASVDVSTGLEQSGGSAHEVVLTGALNWHIGSGNGFVPYFTVGGGVISGVGSLSSIDIEGSYRFVVFNAPDVAFHETDRVRLRFERGTTPVALAGGGVRRNLSDRWGFKIDGRVLIGRENSRLLIDAHPDVESLGFDYIEMLGNPTIQFSNGPASGRVSSLSGDALEGFEVFKGTGWQTRVFVTAGVYFRF